LSAAGLVLCLFLAAFGSRRRRGDGASWHEHGEDIDEGVGEGRVRRGGRPARIAAPFVVGGVASAVAGVPTGLLVAALTGMAMVTRRARALVAAGSVAAVVLAGAYTAVQQYRYRYPPEFEWPTFFHRAHVL